jgi:hypothetical protein
MRFNGPSDYMLWLAIAAAAMALSLLGFAIMPILD